MRDQEKKPFAVLMAGVCANYQRDVTKELLQLFWQALDGYSLEAVTKAFNAHVRTSRFMPTMADIFDLLANDTPGLARPGADEAWLKTPPEEMSYWATDEMLGAWAVVAAEMHADRPDKIAARMAFKSAYERLVNDAKAHGRPVRWQLIRGTRNDNLEDTIREGVRLGYMPRAEADDLLRIECRVNAGLVPLLEGAVASHSEAAREAVAALKRMLNPQQPVVDWERVHADLAETENRIAAEMRRRTGTNG